MEKLMSLVVDCACILLESGAETFRVEDTIKRIFNSYGIKDIDSFVLPTGIFISYKYHDEYKSAVKRINDRNVNLKKLIMINELSRKIEKDKLSLEQFELELLKIKNYQNLNSRTLFLYAFIGSIGFTFYFNGDYKDALMAGVIGGITKLVVSYLDKQKIISFFSICLGGVIIALLALITKNLDLISNLDSTIIGTIMILMPGLLMTNAIRDSLAGDLTSGITRATEAILIAVSASVGAGAILSLWHNIFGGIL